MNIKTLLETLNPSRKLLIWITVTAVAAIPTVWFASAKISAKKVMDDVRLTNLETSVGQIETKVDSLTVKFDDAEKRFRLIYKLGVEEVGNIIKTSDQQQTDQIKFLVENWSEENRLLISKALELKQDKNETKIDEMLNDVKQQSMFPKTGEPVLIPLDDNDNEIYSLNNASSTQLDSISKNYKIISVEPTTSGNYNIKYRQYTLSEKQDITYLDDK